MRPAIIRADAQRIPLADNFVDAIVTDPPYGLKFMGKDWDHGIPGAPFWAEALRVAKPGAHLLAFGGTRTFHRLTCAIEDAGWEIRDSIGNLMLLGWIYGQGFPKSLDISKAIDKEAGADRAAIGKNPNARPNSGRSGGIMGEARGAVFNTELTAPSTDLARQWQGWGTALKPAWEPIIMARKPLEGTVAGNVGKWGTGGINVDGCRIPLNGEILAVERSPRALDSSGAWGFKAVSRDNRGRFPANVCLDKEAAAMLDEQAGECPTGNLDRVNTSMWGNGKGRSGIDHRGDSGGPSRFFYTAKASRNEREAGCEGLGWHPPKHGRSNEPGGLQVSNATNPVRNHHPTVKPISLMRWLCRLVTPPGGLVLDPFCGSGTTGAAAAHEGFRFIGIELEMEYARIARARLDEHSRQGTIFALDNLFDS